MIERPQRLVRVALIALVAFVTLAACVPPTQHGRAAFDAWVLSRVTTVYEHPAWLPPTTCGFYNRYIDTVYLDIPCIKATSYGDPSIEQFRINHEYGHALDDIVFLGARGSTDCIYLPGGEVVTCRTWEETAQCVAEVTTGRTFPSDPPKGYWACPPDEVERIRLLMIGAGAW